MMNRSRIIVPILIIFLLGDFTFSFIQYYNTPLYGDIENCVLPQQFVQDIIDDPLGFKAIITGENHLNPNRYFSHLPLMVYFQNVPFWFQKFVSPVSSLYLSSALLKIIVQLLFVFSLSFFISGRRNIMSKEFLYCAVIIAPLFQVYGYYSQMGINDKSISYTFFYALPIVFLMLFFIPVFKKIYFQGRFGLATSLFLFPLTIILPLSGPLVAGVVLITSFLIAVGYLVRVNSFRLPAIKEVLTDIPLQVIILLILINLWSLYSLYLGFYNSNYESETITVIDRYNKLPKGIFTQIFRSFGYPLMLMVIGVNIYLIKINHYNSKGKTIINSLKWIGIFALLYILLLPLGGYRPYRPLSIRYDTIMPVTIALIYIFGVSTYFLVKHFNSEKRKYYIMAIAACLCIFTIVDFKGLNRNYKERQALNIMANSTDSIVKIPAGYRVMAWEDMSDYNNSEEKAEFLYRWGITNKKKLFYNETENK